MKVDVQPPLDGTSTVELSESYYSSIMELKSADQWKELLASVDNFVFDCDGK